jgi:GTP 3',8-cyclase
MGHARNFMKDAVYNRFNPYKCLAYADKLEDIAKGNLPYPVIWHIYPTNICNHNCSFCIMKSEHGIATLPKEILFKAIEDANITEAKTIHFSGGGEPLLHKDIVEVINYAKKYGLKVALSTNGTFLTQEIYDLVDFPRVSLNAGTKEVHEKLMGAKTFDLIVENLRKLKDRKKMGLAFVLTYHNVKDIISFCQLADILEVGFVHIRPAYLKDDGKTRAIMEEANEYVAQAKRYFQKLDIYAMNDKFDGYWNERKYDKCRATPMNVVLKANGRFIPCQDRLDLEFGDYKNQTFKGIWKSEEHKILINNINMDICPRCVMTKTNEIIQHFYIQDDVLKELL